MVQALHIDGAILFLASILMVFVGQGYHCWRFRVPIFVLAMCYFTLSIVLLGVYRPSVSAFWIYLRMSADISTLGLSVLYFRARRRPGLPRKS